MKRERGRRCVIQCFDSVGTDWLASGLWPYQILTMLLSPGNLVMMMMMMTMMTMAMIMMMMEPEVTMAVIV